MKQQDFGVRLNNLNRLYKRLVHQSVDYSQQDIDSIKAEKAYIQSEITKNHALIVQTLDEMREFDRE